MITTVLQIGNNDDKLTQREWCNFVKDVNSLVSDSCAQQHFFGAPSNWSPWQNAAWIFVLRDNLKYEFWAILENMRIKYRQDSIAVTEGETRFFGEDSNDRDKTAIQND